MLAVSEEFVAAMKSRPYFARITLDETDVIENDAVDGIDFTAGACDSSEAVSLGTAVAGSVEVRLHIDRVNCSIAGRKMFIELGIEIGGETQWIPMGTYWAADATQDDDLLTVPGLDAMAYKFEKAYESLEGIDFTAEGGVSSKGFVTAICSALGVEADVSDLDDVALTEEPAGFTWRQCVAMVGALSGKFAYIDRYGVLRFRWYAECGVTVSADDYYADGMEKAAYGFTVGWLKCYVERLAETICQGDTDASQGIYFVCPWMSEERLAALWEKLGGFSYQPAPKVAFLGDPRLEPGDIVTLETADGSSARVPVMSIRNEFDGGIVTELAATGAEKTDSYTGPVQRAIKDTKRAVSKIEKTVESIVMNVTDLEGRYSELEQTAGQVSVEVADEDSKLETVIDSKNWRATYTDSEGNVISGLHFDFVNKRFVLNAAGRFIGLDSGNYMEIVGDSLILYDTKNIPVLELGYREMAAIPGVGHSGYFKLNAIEVLNGNGIFQSSVIVQFSDGVWIGNDAYTFGAIFGNFMATSETNGIFINQNKNSVSLYKNGEAHDLYTGEAIAKFA